MEMKKRFYSVVLQVVPQIRLLGINRYLFICLLLNVFVFVNCTMSVFAQGMHLVEAESFMEKGGWVLDQQFMDQMGSPFLLAHGLGEPVQDAVTELELSRRGEWHVYVRTWNWCSPWGTEEAPGRFKVVVNDVPLPNELGTGRQWGWEYAGSVHAEKTRIELRLKDLTGFEGRCDALVFSQKREPLLPNEGVAMDEFRKKMLGLSSRPQSAGEYDLVVVGGGVAGICTAIKASREGLRVALIHDRPVAGGNSSVEVKVDVSGEIMQEPFPALGKIVQEIGCIYRSPQKVESLLRQQEHLFYFPCMHAIQVEKKEDRIIAIVAKNIESSEEKIFYAPLFVDCTGDGNVGFMAGAAYRSGREMRQETRETLAPDFPDNMVLGTTITWKSSVVNYVTTFPECKWGVQVTDKSCEKVFSGNNFWETGFRYDQVEDAEFIRDYMFRAIYGNWAFLKNQSKYKEEYSNRELSYMTYIAGKRESRRLLGDVFFKQQDIEGEFVKYDDAIVTGTYSIDLHYPTPKNTFFFPGEEFMSTMKHGFNPLGVSRMYLRDDQVNPPYRIPYRCLYSKNIENLFMAGRNISVSHIALSSTRVQRTTGMMGELVAVAAGLCKKYNCTPRQVYIEHLDELLTLLK